jgi:acylphosphatase
MNEVTTAFYAVVRGRVQGVGFRDFVASRARGLRITGYVRNLPDYASVEVLAEGPRGALDRLVDHLHRGPGMSRVDRVDLEWREAIGEYKSFETRY